MAPLVSVIVTVYNKAPFLEQCLHSLLRQTLSDIELICIDDGSTDNSDEILHQFALLDQRVTVIAQQNVGQSGARNKGLSMASGEYVTFCDADDFLDEAMLCKMYQTAKKHGADTVLCGFNLWDGKHSTPHTGLNDLLDEKPLIGDEIGSVIVKNIFTKKVAAGTHNRIYLRELLLNHHITFHEQIFIMEDYLFNLQVCEVSGCQVILKEPYYYYRVSNGNSVSSSFSMAKLRSFLTLWQEMSKIVEKQFPKELPDFTVWSFDCLLLLVNQFLKSSEDQHEAQSDIIVFCKQQQVKLILSKKGLVSTIFREEASVRRKLSRFMTYFALKHSILSMLLRMK